MKKSKVIDDIINLFLEKGDELYGGEAVTQLEHALQAAHFAKLANASDELVTAALLHDIGHLLHHLPDNATEQGIDDMHEELGAQFLNTYFKPIVVEAVKLHVPAKRYLCLVDPAYYSSLSPTSKSSLILQGGIMTTTEKESFEKLDYFMEAIALRKWDDLAKVPALAVNNIQTYSKALQNALI